MDDSDEHCLIVLKSLITVGFKSRLPNKISRFGLLSVFNPPYRAKHLPDFSYLVYLFIFFTVPTMNDGCPPPCLSLTFSFLFHRIYPNTLPSPRGSEQGISSIFITLPQHEIFSSRTFPFHLWHRELNNTLPRFTVILSISAPSNFL